VRKSISKKSDVRMNWDNLKQQLDEPLAGYVARLESIQGTQTLMSGYQAKALGDWLREAKKRLRGQQPDRREMKVAAESPSKLEQVKQLIRAMNDDERQQVFLWYVHGMTD
jgi:hypothetical protein